MKNSHRCVRSSLNRCLDSFGVKKAIKFAFTLINNRSDILTNYTLILEAEDTWKRVAILYEISSRFLLLYQFYISKIYKINHVFSLSQYISHSTSTYRALCYGKIETQTCYIYIFFFLFFLYFFLTKQNKTNQIIKLSRQLE